jgi:hypothetical protein
MRIVRETFEELTIFDIVIYQHDYWGLLAQILVGKCEYHQPLNRQEKMFRQQFEVKLSRKTMGSWVEQVAELLKPVYRAMRGPSAAYAGSAPSPFLSAQKSHRIVTFGSFLLIHRT